MIPTRQRMAVLPEEMQQSWSWVLADSRPHPTLYKDPWYVDHAGKLVHASPTDENTWMTFDTACYHADRLNMLVGFMLQEGEDICCIDLDFKDANSHPDDPALWTTQEQTNRFNQIVETFPTYTERSRSGRGVHLWLHGDIGQGVKYDGVEVYSQERFIICTGNVMRQMGLATHIEMLDTLVNEMRAMQAKTHASVQLVEIAPVISDQEVVERASNAENKEKFLMLWNGRWADLGYPSQSEADFALLSMLTFYSKSNEQCRRIFRQSALGQRDKATKNNRYLNDSLGPIRAREQQEAILLEQTIAHAKQSQDAIIASLAARKQQIDEANRQTPSMPPLAQNLACVAGTPAPTAGGLQYPPGLMGRIAGYFYAQAARPISDMAIISAIGFMSGLCGGAWTISNVGCNLYTILLARSGTGKEGLYTGINRLCNAVSRLAPDVNKFICNTRARSAPALRKDIGEHPWSVFLVGEIGKVFEQIGDRRNPTMYELGAMWTELYSKSGPGSRMHGMSYSNRENNVVEMDNVSFALLGESTPDTFYRSLTDSMMEDGLASRFLAYEYTGDRVLLNKTPQLHPDNILLNAVAEIVNYATNSRNMATTTYVEQTAEAQKYLDDFEIYTTQQINQTYNEGIRQIWNRAHLKLLKLSALVAIGVNYSRPIIELSHVEWAHDLVMKNTSRILEKLDLGEIGGDEVTCVQVLHKKAIEFFTTQHDYRYGHARENNVVPRSWLYDSIRNYSCFKNNVRGVNLLVVNSLRTLVDNGKLAEVSQVEIARMQLSGQHYRVLQS